LLKRKGIKMATLAQRRKARKAYEAAKKKPVGAGARFKALEKVAKAGGARKPAAVAAAIGRKKYGKKKFQAMAIAGRKRRKK